MHSKLYIIAIWLFLQSNLCFAIDKNSSSASAVTSTTGNNMQHVSSPSANEASGLASTVANAKFFAKILPELYQAADKEHEKLVVELTNSQLYGTNLRGEKVFNDRKEALVRNHSMFCSPLSGYETRLFSDCKIDLPTRLQHADIKPSILLSQSRLTADDAAIVKNWIRNIGISDNEKDQVYASAGQLELPEIRNSYLHSLLDQRWGSIVSDSLASMLARRMIVDPKNPNSPSVASAIEREVNSSYLNPEWHKEVANSNSALDLSKEQLRLTALQNVLLNDLYAREERNALLLTTMVALLSEQQVQMREFVNLFPGK